MTST
jgi:hypothetical protein